MSVRLEWTTAGLVSTRWLGPGESAADGNRPTYGGGALQIGPLVIEGSPEEILELLARAALALPSAGMDVYTEEAVSALDRFLQGRP